MKKTRILTPKTTYTVDYPEAIKFAETQANLFWPPTEPKVEKDVQDLMVNMTEAERHGVITTLKLFTLYELQVGNDYWLGRVKRIFKRPDIERMATTFGFFEIGVHAPFYNRINEVLMIDTDEFYNSYLEDETLRSRMEFIENAASDPDILYSLGVFSLIEGAVLYANFAFLKHFQSKGKNLITNVGRGIDFSVRDENLHHLGGAWLFNQTLKEQEFSAEKIREIHDKIIEAARNIEEHEDRIIDMIFEKGRIEGITDHQMKQFIRSRLNVCLQNMGIGKIYKIDYDPISEWFYKGINMMRLHDFFVGAGSSYHRNWSEESFSW